LSTQVIQENLKPAGPEKKPQPIITETFLVQVQSPTCKCLVTASGDINGLRRVHPINRCNGSHDQMMHELAVIAQKQLQRLIGDIIEARRPC
jgi:hypothetical protein